SDTNKGVFPVSAMEWTPSGDLIVATRAIRQPDNQEMPVISVIPAAAIASGQPYEQSAEVYFAFDEPGAGTIQWVALSRDGSQLLYVEKGNVWVVPFTPNATPRQLTTGFWAGDAIGAGWTGQCSPDGRMIALANRAQRQFIIPNHTGAPINLGLKENERRYVVGESLVSHIDAWLP